MTYATVTVTFLVEDEEEYLDLMDAINMYGGVIDKES